MISGVGRMLRTAIRGDARGNSPSPDMDEAFFRIHAACAPFTMTSADRMYALYKSTEYVIKNDIPGVFVECGVWRGGSAMVVAHTLLSLGTTRELWLYDTFSGMTTPTHRDVNAYGIPAIELFGKYREQNVRWAQAGLDEAANNIARTGYPAELIRYVVGPVEETIPAAVPDSIALLRLDTDWYESTSHELNYLYPLLSSDGVLIIDDYGHWNGARLAVDEYLSNVPGFPMLQRIDYTGRMLIKRQYTAPHSLPRQP